MTCSVHGHHGGICWRCADARGLRQTVGARIVEDAFALAEIVARASVTLCGCGEGRSCDCGGDLARRILRERPEESSWAVEESP